MLKDSKVRVGREDWLGLVRFGYICTYKPNSSSGRGYSVKINVKIWRTEHKLEPDIY